VLYRLPGNRRRHAPFVITTRTVRPRQLLPLLPRQRRADSDYRRPDRHAALHFGLLLASCGDAAHGSRHTARRGAGAGGGACSRSCELPATTDGSCTCTPSCGVARETEAHAAQPLVPSWCSAQGRAWCSAPQSPAPRSIVGGVRLRAAPCVCAPPPAASRSRALRSRCRGQASRWSPSRAEASWRCTTTRSKSVCRVRACVEPRSVRRARR